MMRLFKIVVRIALVLALAIQVYRPAKENRPVDPTKTLEAIAAPPAEVTRILRNACFDCHSDETRWLWYSEVAPVSWFTIHHVTEAREAVNFSRIGALSDQDRKATYESCGFEIAKKKMPLSNYQWMHAAARLSTEDRKMLVEWFDSAAAKISLGDEAAPSRPTRSK